MNWLQRLERRKTVRKLAGRILWKDMKAVFCSWRVIFLLLMVGGYLVFPYWAVIDTMNMGVFVYIGVIFLMMLGVQFEPYFFFLPVTQQEIRKYITVRMNLMIGGTVLSSAAVAVVMGLAGVSVYVERGAASTLSLLFLIEFCTAMFLYDNRGKEMRGENLHGKAKRRKIRFICYMIFMCVAWCYQIISVMFMKEENGKGLLMIGILCFAILPLMYADIIRWTEYKEYREKSKGNFLGTHERNRDLYGKKGAA